MEQIDLEPIRRQLQQTQARLQEEIAALETKLGTARRVNAQLSAALFKLSGDQAQEARERKTARAKQSKPAATKKEMVDFIHIERSQNSNLHDEELKSNVENRLVEAGYSRLGFALRFKEALTEIKTHAQERPAEPSLAMPPTITASGHHTKSDNPQGESALR